MNYIDTLLMGTRIHQTTINVSISLYALCVQALLQFLSIVNKIFTATLMLLRLE